MRFGHKVSQGISFGKKAAGYGAVFARKFSDIVSKGSAMAVPIGAAIGAFNPVLGAEIVSLASLAQGAGEGAKAIANALERSNPNRRIM